MFNYWIITLQIKRWIQSIPTIKIFKTKNQSDNLTCPILNIGITLQTDSTTAQQIKSSIPVIPIKIFLIPIMRKLTKETSHHHLLLKVWISSNSKIIKCTNSQVRCCLASILDLSKCKWMETIWDFQDLYLEDCHYKCLMLMEMSNNLMVWTN